MMLSNKFLSNNQNKSLEALISICCNSVNNAINSATEKEINFSLIDTTLFKKSSFKEYIDKKIHDLSSSFIVNQLFDGKFSGENLLIINQESLASLTIYFQDGENLVDNNKLKDISLELANLMSTKISSKVAELNGNPILFSPPNVNTVNIDLIEHYEIDYDNVIIINSLIEFENHSINCELIMMLKAESIPYLQNALDSL